MGGGGADLKMCIQKKCNLKCLAGGSGVIATAVGTGCQKLKLFSIY